MDVFQAFAASDQPYAFLKIKQGTIRGDVISEEVEHNGVFKFRKGITSANGIQTTDSTATLHVRPSDYNVDESGWFIGHGIRKDEVDYKIVGATGGRNFNNNKMEHYTLTLQRADYGN